MPNEILVSFLSAGLINVSGDDAKLDKLRETAKDLAARIKKSPGKATSFALVAFDPEAPVDDPVIKETLEALQWRWPTYVNTFSGTPVTVLRAVLLDALAQAAADDTKVAVAFVASARNALPFMEAANEQAIWGDMVTHIERQVDARAELEWATPASIKVSPIAFAAPEPIQVSASSVTINKTSLAKKLEAAAGPHSQSGATGGNPHWPQQQAHWVSEFGKRMADAVGEAIDSVAAGSKIKPIDFSGPLTDLSHAVSTHVDEALKAVNSATAGLQRRTNLIWWKEALYSPSAQASYRSMPTSTAAALMSFDLHQQIPTYSPASVAAFLHEGVCSLPSINPTQGRPIRDLLSEAIESKELASFRQTAAQLVSEPAGRGPILGLLGYSTVGATLDDRIFRSQIGVPAGTQLTLPQWATWLFRELQAARAVRNGTETKKRGRQSS